MNFKQKATYILNETVMLSVMIAIWWGCLAIKDVI